MVWGRCVHSDEVDRNDVLEVVTIVDIATHSVQMEIKQTG